ncbi:MAG: Transcriptional regulatory protein ZraR [Candidatus Hydrogenedentes bacterium ADurb.Bin101]|nr:MAG: Transcriptional regulatory protein ZraR [Candidatus Hydrogenedentes bacterium ADurb.Bin101]
MSLPNAQIVAVRGPLKGLSWRVGKKGLLLGRSAECDIALPDPEVSRKQCRILIEESQLRFEDLGGRNPALINGRLAKKKILEFGDELAAGASLFVLARTEARDDMKHTPDAVPAPTCSWHGQAVSVTEGVSEETPLQLRPRSTEDLFLLCEASMTFNRCENLPALFSAAETLLRHRFHTSSLWMALTQGGDTPEFVVTERENTQEPMAEAPPQDLLFQAIRERKGLLVPEPGRTPANRALRNLMIAPARWASENVLVTAVRQPPERPVFDEDDLGMLILLMRSLASFVRAVQHTDTLRRELDRLRLRQGESTSLIGSGNAMRRVLDRIQQAAQTNIAALITGETGTGKELAARAIHARSARRNMPFIAVNCAAIPRELFEGEIFGYEKGAYTGAHKASTGLLEEAHGGILFLDEIGDLSLENQARILRVVENCAFRRLGGKREIHADIRFLAATNHDLRAAVRAGRFREDLFHRINAIEIGMPALRDHREDIPELTEHFFHMFRHQARRPLAGIDPRAMEYLTIHPWPGNIRELRNVLYRAVTLARAETLGLADVADLSAAQSAAATPELTLEELERGHIAAIFRQCDGNIQQTATILGIARSTLYKKLAEFGIHTD